MISNLYVFILMTLCKNLPEKENGRTKKWKKNMKNSWTKKMRKKKKRLVSAQDFFRTQ